MKCQWNDEEQAALRRVPWRARVVYLQGIRWKMNFKTGIAGRPAVVSYDQLHETLRCSVAESTKPDPPVQKEGLRAIFRMLERAGLVEWIKHGGKGLIFQCLLADTDQSDLDQDNPKTTPKQPQEDNPSNPSNRNGSSDQDNPKTTRRQPQLNNPPPDTVYRKEEGFNNPVDLAPPTGRDRARIVFTYWQSTLNHPRAKLDDKRRRAINARLRDGYSVEDLKQAIDGCKASGWHQGQNPRQAKFDDIELICRNASKVDLFRAAFERAGSAHDDLDDWLNEDRIIEGQCNAS